jgi:hypothetical protein
MSSWLALFTAAVAMWLILKGPAAKKPSWVQKLCRFAMAFFLYSGFLYLLKWDPFWRWMPSVDFENRNRAEGFLILISTLVWIIATLRILLLGSRFPALLGVFRGLENHVPPQENARRRLSLTDLALFYLFMRK